MTIPFITQQELEIHGRIPVFIVYKHTKNTQLHQTVTKFA